MPAPRAADGVKIDGMTWSGAAVAETRRPATRRRAAVLGISAIAVMVAGGVAYSALQSVSGPANQPLVAAAAAPIGAAFAPAGTPAAAPVPTVPVNAAPAPATDPVTTAAIPRATDRLPDPATASPLPPPQAVTTTAFIPQPAATQPASASPSTLPTGAEDPVGDAILIAEKDGPGPVGAAPTPAPAAAPQPAPTVVAALPTPRQTQPTPAPAPTTRVTAPAAAAVAPAPVVPAGPRVQATARDYVNLRSGPSNGSSVVTVVAAGSAVEVIRCNYWCQVQVNGRTGWIYQDFLDGPIDRRSRGRAVAPAPATTTAAAQ
jgi:hypothetical protein